MVTLRMSTLDFRASTQRPSAKGSEGYSRMVGHPEVITSIRSRSA
jgi:hypothetical protein